MNSNGALLLILINSCISIHSRFVLYNSDGIYPTFDCLYAHLIEEGREIGMSYLRTYHLIPYCRRPQLNVQQREEFNENIAQTLTFAQLRERNVTSEQLLEWFAPIDIAERYEMNIDDQFSVFHNCTRPWFGSMCQYRFEYDRLSLSFGQYLQIMIENSTGTCYPFIRNCNYSKWPLCLDWREICDGKIDCSNGEDEAECYQFENTQCQHDEYRCHFGGQCIPNTFVKDNRLSMDCLDGSDEIDTLSIFIGLVNIDCWNVKTFRCRERIGRYLRTFQCGDGQYITIFALPHSTVACSNRRDIEYSRSILTSLDHIKNVQCRQVFSCALFANRKIDFEDYSMIFPGMDTLATLVNQVRTEDCQSLSDSCSNEWLVLPEYPFLYGFFQLVYFTNRSIAEFKTNVISDFICWNSNYCSALMIKITSLKLIANLTCTHTSQLISDSEYLDFDRFMFELMLLSQICSTTSIDNQYPLREDQIYAYTQDLTRIVPFSFLCDRSALDLITFSNQSQIDTLQIHCNLWPCNNAYTKCDQIWHCPNGLDELNCSYNQCSPNEYECENICLPRNSLFEKYTNTCDHEFIQREIYFSNQTNLLTENYFSWQDTTCIHEDQLCSQNHTFLSYCTVQQRLTYVLDVKSLETNEHLCYLNFPRNSQIDISNQYSTSYRFGYFPHVTMNYSASNLTDRDFSSSSIESDAFCNLGFSLFSSTKGRKFCLCPPNYFGDRCQWQNQRLSLTLQFVPISTTNMIFQIVVMLVDEYGQISSNNIEQILYIPSRDCNTKFNIYLLYPDRPKNLSRNYSIRIDLFERIKLIYWSSWRLTIPFPFMPVNRLSARLHIPSTPSLASCSHSCGEHGKCMLFINDRTSFFCRCDRGYSGIRCEIQSQCRCAMNSVCLTESICICPLDRFGSFCYLKNSICSRSRNPCQNHGLCVPQDVRINSKGFLCFCQKNYSGDRCENLNTHIDIYFSNYQIIENTSQLLIHLITTFNNAEHQRITILKKLPFYHSNVSFYHSQPFHLMFIEISNHSYYLAVVREIFIPTENISTKIDSQRRCLAIHELNQTLSTSEYFYRTKFYPLFCQQNVHLNCFYDRDFLCLCDLDRFSNCLLFNHSINYTCQQENPCENQGQCFENNHTCSTNSICICSDCYYGSRCQFSTKGFLFSLDQILAYHIKPSVPIKYQPLIIRLSILIHSIMISFGLVSSILSITFFHRKSSRKLGTGYYLFFSSISSLLLTCLFIWKFWHLIFSQMFVHTNRSWLKFNCYILDYFLKIFLAISEWLNACVAIERMISIIHGIRFNKKQSRIYSKYIIMCVVICISLTHVHDPIFRQLIDDDDDGDGKRTWCFVQYSDTVEIYNALITCFHFLVPFSINLFSSITIIRMMAFQRSVIQPDQTYRTHLQQQIFRHQHLLYAPCLLIILSLPRLIISFFKGCMRTAREPWLYLIGYFVSFIPSMLTFMVFVLPSRHYKKEFKSAFQQTVRRLHRV